MARDIVPIVYLLASHRNGTLYAGVTSNLMQRLYQHREGVIDGFSKDYGTKRLVWFEAMRPWKAQLFAKSGSRHGTALGKSS